MMLFFKVDVCYIIIMCVFINVNVYYRFSFYFVLRINVPIGF